MTTFQLTISVTVDDIVRSMLNADLSELDALIEQLMRLRAKRHSIISDEDTGWLLEIDQPSSSTNAQ